MHVSVLKNLLLFQPIPLDELEVLAGHFQEVSYAVGEALVNENELIDSVYVLLQGKAEVSRKNRLADKIQHEILAVLTKGETIGLNDLGFYSQTGERTATVTAITPVLAVRLELKDLQHFLQVRPHLLVEMQKEIDHLLKHAFIKKLEPFAEINHEVLKEITPHIETWDVVSETTLFHQGDVADCCYLLCDGKVDVLLNKADGTQKSIATVEPGELLGEMALFTDTKRNATLKTLTPCRLLVIQRKEFQKLVEHSQSATGALTSLLMDRHRPLRCEEVAIHQRMDAENQTIVILHNKVKGNYVKTSLEGLFVWEQLDGEHTLQDIAIAYFYKYRKLAVDTIGQFVLYLMQTDFVKVPRLAEYVPHARLPRWIAFLSAIRSVMQYEYSIKNVDSWITRLYQRMGYVFFTKTAELLMAVIAVTGFVAFVMYLPEVSQVLKHTQNAWLLLILAWPLSCLLVPLHELAHALTTKHYGHRVDRLGVGWFWLGPIAFADTSDMWLSTRTPRIVVNLSGIYVNVIVSGGIALITWFIGSPSIAVLLWLVALSSYLMAFYNLDPMFELDGYYVLMDVMDKPNLRSHATRWLVQDLKKTLVSRKLMRAYFAEISYWMMSLVFILLSAGMAYVLQTFVFNNIVPETVGHAHPSHFKWLFSAIVILLSFASVYGRIKQQNYLLHHKK